VFVFFIIDDQEVIYPYLITFNFSRNILILFFNMFSLCYIKEDWLEGDACFRPPITIRCHNLHVGDMKRDVGDIASYHDKD
jgi:hypothetical protein